MDDSTTAEFERNKTTVEKYRHRLKIIHKEGAGKHLHSMADRKREGTIAALKDIDTEYFSLSSDDDFLLLNFVERAIDELENDRETVAVHGPEAKVYFDHFGKYKRWAARPWSSNYFNDPLDRLYDYIHEISLLYYGVCRKSCLKQFNHFYESNNRDLFSRVGTGFHWFDIEVAFVVYLHMAGNSKYLPNDVMNIRMDHQSPDRLETFRKDVRVNEWTVGPIFSLCNPNTSGELQQTVNDTRELLKGFGSSYEDQILEFAAYKTIWSIMTRKNQGLVDHRTSYFQHRFGKNRVQSFQKRTQRLLQRQKKKLQATQAIKRNQQFSRFLLDNKDISHLTRVAH